MMKQEMQCFKKPVSSIKAIYQWLVSYIKKPTTWFFITFWYAVSGIIFDRGFSNVVFQLLIITIFISKILQVMESRDE